MRLHQALLLASAFLASLTAARPSPTYEGFTPVQVEEFVGPTGAALDERRWNHIIDLRVNNELQRYTRDRLNVQISGGGTLQLVPWKDARGNWTSGRVEDRQSFTPRDGGVTFVEAEIRFGVNPTANLAGMWPAFWLLGESVRHGTEWPECGEIDILEARNGSPEMHGALHCDRVGGGACNTPVGISNVVDVPDRTQWRRWRVQIDRTNPDWRAQSIEWSVDGQVFHAVNGDRVGDEKAWKALAHSGMYVILNVAVGGHFPGPPDDATLGGYGSMMEVGYVVVYNSI